MKTLAAAFALALAISSVVVAAADFSGTWNVDGDVAGYPVQFACTLKQVDQALTGTATIGGKEVNLTGSAKESVVTFTFDVDHEGTTYTNVFTGKLGDNGVIDGTIEVGGQVGTFTAKKP